ncbi:hypothetical protein ETAA8_20180 [Anatilimnocola aggregata]|uniref:Uncharacterized protein n=1 Tax=Anatilimnocola aggregata TaxID=2528021 RepID=A0A517Y9M9_9BACT|nr:hypothetical protein [Anatilimnocola aggregata]QDU26934.1 hypothetical protein ETAA8_20180 [Anatilimnocola aggregata]
MIRPFAFPWQIATLGVLTLATIAGCALPGLGLRKHDDLLSSLTADEFEGKLSPPPELIQEPSPYPTAVKQNNPQAAPASPAPGNPAASTGPAISLPLVQPQALPLQQTGIPAARPLDPQQLAGRLPIRTEPKPQQPTAPAASASNPYESREHYLPVTPPAPAETAVQTALSSQERNWPVTTPLGSLNSLVPAPHEYYAPPASIVPTARAIEPVAAPTIALVSHQPENVKGSLPSPDHTLNASASPADDPVAAKVEEEALDELCQKHIAALEREIRQRTDRKEEAELPALRQKLRLLQLIADRNDDAVDKVEQLPPAEREAFKQMMFALSTWLSPDDAKRPSSRNAKILRSLQEVNNSLSAASKLDLSNLMFCEKVESFGWYTEFSRAEFTPKQQVILYVEVQNFAAEEKSATSFETELQGSYQIYDAAGNLIDERQLPLDREICRNYRRDYFLAYRIYLPAELAAGKYRLELTIQDLKAKPDFKGRKQGEAMIEFAIKS